MFVRSLKLSLKGVTKRVATAPHLLVLLDFDGTLAPFEADPSAARVSAPAREWLNELARCPRATVGIISGRSLADLVARVDLDGLVYAGNYGNEIRGRGLSFVEPFAFLLEPALKRLLTDLSARLSGFPEVRLEDKRRTAAVHMRGANADEAARAAAIVWSVVNACPQFRCRRSRDCFDILPRNGWHKGSTVRWIRRELDLADALVVYVGDDDSDEDAFSALPGQITIKVGAPPTQASYVADSPVEVWAFLARLTGALASLPQPPSEWYGMVPEHAGAGSVRE